MKLMTADMKAYQYHSGGLTEDPWISFPENGGDIGDLSDIANELNRLRVDRDALAEALHPFTMLNPKSPRVQKFWDGFVSKARDALRGISSENAKAVARQPGAEDNNTNQP